MRADRLTRSRQKPLSEAEPRERLIIQNMYYVYVLKSKKDSRFYIGFSTDLKQRLKEHNEGKVKSTKSRRPLELVYYEAYKDENKARRQELFYKTGQGRRILKKRLEE